MLIAMIADIDAQSLERFRAYEEVVLPLLASHGGHLERRMRSAEGTTEIHLIAFNSPEGYRSYLEDPARLQAKATLGDARIEQRVLLVTEVPNPHS
jgi:uncharacterized protein (DUF1330 family)